MNEEQRKQKEEEEKQIKEVIAHLDSQRMLIIGLIMGLVLSFFASLFVAFFQIYFSTWPKWAISLGLILSGIALIILLLAILKIYLNIEEKTTYMKTIKSIHDFFKNVVKKE